MSGVLEAVLSPHLPTFCIINNTVRAIETEEQQYAKYDYCESNLIKFSTAIEQKLIMPTITNTDYRTHFSVFCDTIKNTIDECFLTDEKTTKSKRNRLVNPWITSGIIASVEKKNFLYKKWKKSTNKKYKIGDQSLYTYYIVLLPTLYTRNKTEKHQFRPVQCATTTCEPQRGFV